MDDKPQNAIGQAKKKETKSDLIAHTTVEEYLRSHAKPNGGFKSFFHSNLFVALLLWILSQAVIFGGFIISFYMKSTQLSEWKGNTDATIKRMDDSGTIYGKFTDDKEKQDIAVLQDKVSKLEQDTRQLPVIESEHKRLTKDVDDLTHGKK